MSRNGPPRGRPGRQPPDITGGAGRSRTDNPRITSAVLCRVELQRRLNPDYTTWRNPPPRLRRPDSLLPEGGEGGVNLLGHHQRVGLCLVDVVADHTLQGDGQRGVREGERLPRPSVARGRRGLQVRDDAVPLPLAHVAGCGGGGLAPGPPPA